MNKKKSRIIILSLIIFIICISSIFIYSRNKSTDKSTLIENSLSKQYKHNTQIEIFDSYMILDYEIVGFTIVGSQKCGFAVMKQDGNSRYKVIRVVRYEKLIKRALDTFIEYITLYDDKSAFGQERYIVVVSMNDKLAEITMSIEDGKPIHKEITSTPSLTVLEYPMGTSKGEYLFYDKSGNLIR